MIRIIHYRIPSNFSNSKILHFLHTKHYSRSVITHLKQTENGITLNGIPVHVNKSLTPGDILSITLKEPPATPKFPPNAVPLSIAYEDEDILVINKPAGMPTHPSMDHYEHTLANAVTAYLHDDDNSPFIYRCINRLDKDTSGLTIIAKHMLSACVLGTAMKERRIHREYIGIAEGMTADCGTIDAPIARKEGSILERTVDFEKGEHAITHYRRLKYENRLSLVSLNLETGRTHQIRVHMQFIHHPLIGDFLYHPDSHEMKRQALHARYLRFHHPISEKLMEIEAPVPIDFILRP